MANAYYNPGELGLEIVAEIEYSDGSHQFDTRVVWRKVETGELFTARDSGCSCPIPFEDYGSVESLEKFNFDSLRNEALGEAKSGYYRGESVTDFIDKIHTLSQEAK